MNIISIEPMRVHLRTERGLNDDVMVDLIVGQIYEVFIVKPNNKKDRQNNGRIVELLGFGDCFAGEPIVRYIDTNRRGRACINGLKPHEMKEVLK